MGTREKPDPWETAASLVSNAVVSARVLGESPRVTNLVASSVGRLAAELEAEEGRGLIRHALASIDDELKASVPDLVAALDRLLAAPDGGRSAGAQKG